MLGRFLPKEVQFFDLFRESAQLIENGAIEFEKLIANLDNLSKSEREGLTQKVKEIEHQADGVTHKTVALLHQTFITPIDRNDIHLLITKLDDILDFIEAAAVRVHLYQVDTSTDAMKRLGRVVTDSARTVRRAIDLLEKMADPKLLLSYCIELNRLENEADQILRQAMADLFANENDFKRLIKLKEVYELLETVTDRCEDVANIIEGIVLEYA